MSTADKSVHIPTKEKDYLEQDDPIRNQNFVCLSFLSPEDILKKKELFMFEKYVSEFSKKSNELLSILNNLFPEKQEELRIMRDNFDFIFDNEKIHENYKYYIQEHADDLTNEFYTANDFQTCIRGIKVRGVYDTIEEAKARSDKLRKLENNMFSIYVAQVGCWCPWSPNPDDITDQEFAETELNTLMHKYQENLDNKAEFFKTRQNEMRLAIKESEENKKKENSLESDPWVDRKLLNDVEEEACAGDTDDNVKI